MTQFWEFFTFEMRFRIKSISTYIYFLAWLAFSFLCVASESFGPVGNSNGKVLLNGPWANSYNDFGASLFGVIIIAAIFGTSILRDFQRDTFQILFTKPVSKFAYLGGRWAGSFVTTLFVFSGMLAGTWLGTFAPWADHVRIGPNRLAWYLQPFLSIVVVQIFFLGSLFFAVAALTRKIALVYLQGVAFFMLYLIGITIFSATRSLEHFWSGILDPVGFILFDNITRYWTVIEKNTLLLPWDFSGNSPGIFLYNRLLWLGVGLASLAGLWALFPMSIEALTARSQGRRAAKAREQEVEEKRPVRSLVAAALPRVRQAFGPATTFAQYLSLTRLRLRSITREVTFWAIAGLLVVFAVNNGQFAGRVGGVDVWPVTYLMLQAVEGGAMLFFYIIATLYAAELTWRERDTRFDGIHDALPMSVTPDWLSKLTAIMLVEAFLLALTMLVGVVMQTIAGYYRYELLQYLKELYIVTVPQVLAFAFFALFVQTMVSNKFVGHGIVIGIFVLVPVLFNFGWENSLYLPGATPAYTYSDMNGYGHFVPALFWSVTYWLAISRFFGVVSIAHDPPRRRRFLRCAHHVRHGPAPHAAPGARRRAAVSSRRRLRLLVLLQRPRPERISDGQRRPPHPSRLRAPVQEVRTPSPAQGDRSGRGHQHLSRAPLLRRHRTLHPPEQDRRAHQPGSPHRRTRVRFPGEIRPPVPPGEPSPARSVFHLRAGSAARSGRGPDPHIFGGAHHARLPRRQRELPAEFAYNGTFFDAGYFPTIGYDQGYELDDPRRRREQKLGTLEEMASRGDAVHSRINLFTPTSDWITYHTVVSTSGDQIAIAPGYLQRAWEQNGHRFYEYSMGSTHTQDFYAYLSAQLHRSARKPYSAGPNGPVKSGGLLRPRPPLRYRRHAGLLPRRFGLLPGPLQPLPVRAVLHHGVPALPEFCAVVPQHRAVFRRHRVYRAHGAQERHRPDLFRYRA